MKKNLSDQAAANEICERAIQLNAGSGAKWGKMDAAEMLHHCNNVLTATLANTGINNKKSTLRQILVRNVFLHVLPRFPRGAKAPARFDVKRNQVTDLDFLTEKENFIQLIKSYAAHTASLQSFHPVFGNLNDKQWGVLTWMHMDHHLRQFGV